MAGTSEYEAVRNFLAPIARALSCVTRAVPDVSGGYYAAADPHRLTISRGEPVPLRGDAYLALTIIHYYRIIEDLSPAGPWRVTTTTYLYSLDDSEGHEIIGFHWHPHQRTTVTYPHLHLGYGAGTLRADLEKAHIPTGRVTIHDVIRLAIRDLGVTPLRGNWEDVLDSPHEAWER